jgi:hypothetical protein
MKRNETRPTRCSPRNVPAVRLWRPADPTPAVVQFRPQRAYRVLGRADERKGPIAGPPGPLHPLAERHEETDPPADRLGQDAGLGLGDVGHAWK